MLQCRKNLFYFALAKKTPPDGGVFHSWVTQPSIWKPMGLYSKPLLHRDGVIWLLRLRSEGSAPA